LSKLMKPPGVVTPREFQSLITPWGLGVQLPGIAIPWEFQSPKKK
jgi:hypothetical protein